MRIHSHLTCFFLAAAFSVVSVSCSDDGDGGESPLPAQMTRAAVAANLAQNVALPQVEACATNLALLNDEVEAWEADPTTANRDAAREAWSVAYLSWQRCELLQLGPAGRMGDTVGGEGLRFEVYTYPQFSECFVDQEIVNEDWKELDSYGDLSTAKRGLGALEYLLFYDGSENQCGAGSELNTTTVWTDLGDDERNARRRAFAAFIAEGVADASSEIAARWNGDVDNYAQSLATAGDGSADFDSAQQALNEFSNALVYFEKETKDMKLASPLGVSTTANTTCGDDICPDLRESVWANESLAAIRANLEAFAEVYTGGEGTGFDDLLTELGAQQVADDISAEIDTLRNAIDDVETDMGTALTEDREAIVTIFDESRELVTLFKTQFITVLALELPNRAAADND